VTLFPIRDDQSSPGSPGAKKHGGIYATRTH
jgi:hypothetical protein